MNIKELAKLLESPSKDFNGQLVLSEHRTVWTLNFVHGQLLYASDERHNIRRWNRLLKQYLPKWHWRPDTIRTSSTPSWQVHLLNEGIDQRQLSLIRAKLLIRTIAQECLFELSCCASLKSTWTPLSFPISMTYRSIGLSSWEMRMTMNKVDAMQQHWQEAKLKPLNPNLSPVLKGNVNGLLPLPFDSKYLKGEFTLWDIAGLVDRSLIDIVKSLLPLADSGMLTFSSLPDLALTAITPPPALEPASPVAKSFTSTSTQTVAKTPKPLEITLDPSSQRATQTSLTPSQTLIACIDDSPVLTHSLKKILFSAGYQVLTIQEPMRGFSQLIEHKPSLILLDLVLPNADGYSVCKFLRDTPVFEKTPIIILTGQNTPIDRARARVVRATDFLAKPPQPEILIRTIEKHLVA